MPSHNILKKLHFHIQSSKPESKLLQSSSSSDNSQMNYYPASVLSQPLSHVYGYADVSGQTQSMESVPGQPDHLADQYTQHLEHFSGPQVPRVLPVQAVSVQSSNPVQPVQYLSKDQIAHPAATMLAASQTEILKQVHLKEDPSSLLPRKSAVSKGKYSLSDFHIMRTLGTGSFGRVHLVRSVHNGRYYAIKVLKKQQVVKMKQVEHTNDERKMLKLVEHPFIIRMWGTFQDSKNLYMVMDYIEGGELFTLLRKSQRFPNPVAKFYAAEVVLALEYLHAHDIIYRDLKPENVLLDRNGHIKITDFGFAKEVSSVTWTLCGTPDYIAPEVITSKPYNKSVDWWSLGVLIFEMLSGYTPFYDTTPMKTYEKILSGKVHSPSFFQPDVVDLLSRLITADLSSRLGNLVNGPADIRDHPWFSEVVWTKLLAKDIETPYEPPITAGVGDSSLFDHYPEEQHDYGSNDEDLYADLFKEF